MIGANDQYVSQITSLEKIVRDKTEQVEAYKKALLDTEAQLEVLKNYQTSHTQDLK